MRTLIAAAAAVLISLTALTPGTATAAAAHPATCWPPHHATGKKSLVQVLGDANMTVTDEIADIQRCTGTFTSRQAAYFDAGDLNAPMPKGMWYWVGVLVAP